MHILFSAAHGGFSDDSPLAEDAAPLGGGATIANQLVREWRRTQPFDLTLLDPSILGSSAPSARDLTRLNEKSYADFCRRFDAAVTERIIEHDPASARVLVNDISEAPIFQQLAQHGFQIHTIYHVDVVAYVAKIYGRGWASPRQLVQLYDRWGSLFPGISKLVFEKQRQSLQHSRIVIVPSPGMKETLLDCYPETPPDRIRVLPWGYHAEVFDPETIELEKARVRDQYGLHPRVPTLLMLSRISPEKGQDSALEAIADWERQEDGFPPHGLNVLICGEPAYMMGEKFFAKLKELAASLRRTRVHFPGYVRGLRKAAIFASADLYVFPSRHESYGLTLVEALAAGLPAVTFDHDGARAVMRPEFGAVVTYKDLIPALRRFLNDAALRARCGEAGKAWASTQSFAHTARTLAGWILE